MTWQRCIKCGVCFQHCSACPECTTDSVRWYYASGKQKIGPVSLTDLQTLAASGSIQPTTMLLRDGSRRWVAAETVRELTFNRPVAGKAHGTGNAVARRRLLIAGAFAFCVLLAASIGFAIWQAATSNKPELKAPGDGLHVTHAKSGQAVAPDDRAKVAIGCSDVVLIAGEKIGVEQKDERQVAAKPEPGSKPNGHSLPDISKLIAYLPRHRGAFYGHNGSVFSLTFSPDGKWLVTGGEDRSIIWWELSTRRRLFQWGAHTGGVTSLAFAPDGTSLASASDRDSTIKVWDARPDGQPGTVRKIEDAALSKVVTYFKGHKGGITSLAYSPSGKLLASGGIDGTIRLWDMATKQEIYKLKGHKNGVLSLAFSPDGNTLVSGSAEKQLDHPIGVIVEWDVITGKERRSVRTHKHWVRSLAFSPNGKTLASCSDDHTIALRNPENLQETSIISGHTGPVRSVAFSKDGKTLASTGLDGLVCFWDSSTGDQLESIPIQRGVAFSMAFHPTLQLLASAQQDFTARLWELPESGRNRTASTISPQFFPIKVGMASLYEEELYHTNGQIEATQTKWRYANNELIERTMLKQGRVLEGQTNWRTVPAEKLPSLPIRQQGDFIEIGFAEKNGQVVYEPHLKLGAGVGSCWQLRPSDDITVSSQVAFVSPSYAIILSSLYNKGALNSKALTVYKTSVGKIGTLGCVHVDGKLKMASIQWLVTDDKMATKDLRHLIKSLYEQPIHSISRA